MNFKRVRGLPKVEICWIYDVAVLEVRFPKNRRNDNEETVRSRNRVISDRARRTVRLRWYQYYSTTGQSRERITIRTVSIFCYSVHFLGRCPVSHSAKTKIYFAFFLD